MNNLMLATLFVTTVQLVSAQTAFVGTWEGKLNVGTPLRVIFHISSDDKSNFTALMDCPEQGLRNVKVSRVEILRDSIALEIGQFQASYSGKLNGDSTVNGIFKQGVSLPLTMKKVSKVSEVRRSQTPVPPFPYHVEELTYSNQDKSISYGATITIPDGKGPFPAALLLTGSGQQNRDEEIAGHKPFAVIADHLTRNGFIVLRVDDRGMGKTSGDFRGATTRDFTDDAIVSLNFLKSRKEVDQKRIGLIGHSEGGMIAQMIAAERKDISFVVMLAAPGIPVAKLMSGQNKAMFTKAGLPENYVLAYVKLYDNVLSTVTTSKDAELAQNIDRILEQWMNETPANIVSATTGIRDEGSKKEFVKAFAGQLGNPWFRYFLQYDPTINLEKIQANVLALNGSDDVQVLAAPNLSSIESSLKKGKSRNFSVNELPGLNHLFQECKNCSVAEYGQLEQTISPKMLEVMTGWLLTYCVAKD